MSASTENIKDKRQTINGYPLIIIIFSLFLTLALYSASLESLLTRWLRFDESYGHGLLLLVVVAWLFYELKNEIAPANTRLNLKALLILLPSMLLWLIGKASGIIIFEQLSLPLFWWGSIWFLGGWPLAKSVLFPIGFIYFAIPIWDHINSPLVSLSIQVESFLLSLSHLPVLIEGNRFNLPSGVISIADGCSGLRYLIIGLAFGTLASRLYFTSMKMRLFIISLSLVLSLLANWVRIYILILIGYFTEMQSSLMGDHEFFGFWVFGFMLSPLFIIIRYKSEPLTASSHSLQNQKPSFYKLCLVSSPLLLAIMAIGPLIYKLVLIDIAGVLHPKMGSLSGMQIEDLILPNAMLNENDALIQRRSWQFEDEDGWLAVNVRWYFQPKVGEDFLPHRTLINSDSWVIENELSVSDPEKYRQLQMTSMSNGQQWLMRYWVEVGGYRSTNQYIAKLSEMSALFSGRRDALVVQLLAPCDWRGCDKQAEKMDRLLESKKSEFNQLITFNNGSK